MDWITLIGMFLAPFTAAVGWVVGRRKRNNDFLHDMQQSINTLVDENMKLISEIIEIRKQNSHLMIQVEQLTWENEKMSKKLGCLQEQNELLKKEVEGLISKIGNRNVKTSNT